MKTIRESIGFVVAVMAVLGFTGTAGWSVYAALTEQEAAPAATGRKPVVSGNKQQELENRIERLEQEQKMTENAAKEVSSSVALVIGEYIWTDRTGKRPLHYVGVDASGAPMRDEKGGEAVAFDAEGPVVVREFTGTGFLLSSGQVLTSGFVLSPWYDDPLLDESEQPERIPSIRLLHAYFPGASHALDLKIDRAEENAETVLCSVQGASAAAPGLRLSSAAVRTGEALVSVGYAGGVPLLAARLPEDQKRELLRFGTSSTDGLAGWLAEHGRIRPVVMQVRVNGQTDGKIFYDTLNAAGSTGGPLLDADERVVAMSYSTNADFPSLNLALPVSDFKSWLDQFTRVIR
jgi:hypothetical protein